MQPPSQSGGNQIIVTSRIVGYKFSPVIGSFIKHYLLLLMSHKEAKEFMKTWMTQVEKVVLDVLMNEGVKVDEKQMKNISTRQYNTVEAMFEIRSELLISNSSLLSSICTFIFKLSDEYYPKSPVEVYNRAVQTALRSRKGQGSSISESVMTNFLIDLATYLHLHSESGLIDAFDTEHLCCLILKQQGILMNRTELHKYANKVISLLESNIGIVAEKGLQIFGFQHLSFQEYFVAQSLVKGSPIEEVAKRIFSFAINPRFRESLLLAIG